MLIFLLYPELYILFFAIDKILVAISNILRFHSLWKKTEEKERRKEKEKRRKEREIV